MLSQAPVHVSETRPRASLACARHDLSGSLELMGLTLPFSRNCEIYGEGEPAEYVYQVITGAVRTSKILTDGRRQIGAFYLPNDVFGLELGAEHDFSAEAISNATIRVVKQSTLHALAAEDADLGHQLWELTARELKRSQEHSLLLIKNAQERVACFLLEMARRLAPADVVQLPMSRHDIADYLGLTIETVSRTLAHLETTSLIVLCGSRRIQLCNRTALDRLNA
jgi:CRP/FNR family transcriptional regulator, nitrogen fixation regulation protein